MVGGWFQIARNTPATPPKQRSPKKQPQNPPSSKYHVGGRSRAAKAIGFAVLGYLDQNLTSVIVNRPANGLKKGPGYHLDLFVRGALTLPVCAVLGLPLSVASTVPSITHVISLTTYEVQQLPEGERKVPTKVVEQRATNFLIHVLIGCALFLAPVLKFLPRAVLQGIFFYMGILAPLYQ